MIVLDRIYTLGIGAARRLTPLLARGDGKLARGVRGRRGVLERFEQWAERHRRAGAPLVWFHAPSVGEGLQAKAVIEALRRIRPDVQIAYTYFSPSAETFADRVPADVADYLPYDVPRDVARLFDALSPDVVAFCKTEIWPTVTRVADDRGVPAVLLSATLPPSSTRSRTLARLLLAPSHARLTRVAAISRADADRFEALGVPPDRRMVMGDARFDQVLERASTAGKTDLVKALRDPAGVTLVAGSTWPADEDALIDACAPLVERGELRLIMVPHEPTEVHLERLEGRLSEHQLQSVRLSGIEDATVSAFRVLVVDRMGVLGDLYALADVAYVGGGFGSAGIHSVLEPAAFGAPVLFGPRHGNAREAGELVAGGGAMAIPDALALREAMTAWIEDPELRKNAGRLAAAYVTRGGGAAERGARLVAELLKR